MRVILKELLEKLGVDHELEPYEAYPWFHYDEEQGITCSAEVRMGPGGEDLEAEIQYLYDEPQEETFITHVPGDEYRQDQKIEETKTYTYKQIMLMRAMPSTQTEWSPKFLLINSENYADKIGNWEEQGCEFFLRCVQALQMGELPDINALLEELFEEGEGGGRGRRARVGRKSPKVNPNALLNVKKGM